MDHIEWRPTDRANVAVTNDTTDLYSFFDATDFAEFLYACVARTVEHDLPREIAQLRAYDRAKAEILNLFDMSDTRVSLLILLTRQNGGVLPKRRRAKEFGDLSDDEVQSVEAIVQDAFDTQQAGDL